MSNTVTLDDLGNTEQAKDQFDRTLERRTERRRKERNMSVLRQRLERQLADETIKLPMGEEMVEFRTYDRETSEWASVIQERIRRMDGEDFVEEFSAEVDRVYRTLGEHAELDWMDTQWFEAHLSVRRAMQYLVAIHAEAEISEDEAKNLERPR